MLQVVELRRRVGDQRARMRRRRHEVRRVRAGGVVAREGGGGGGLAHGCGLEVENERRGWAGMEWNAFAFGQRFGTVWIEGEETLDGREERPQMNERRCTGLDKEKQRKRDKEDQRAKIPPSPWQTRLRNRQTPTSLNPPPPYPNLTPCRNTRRPFARRHPSP